jgi:uncharacterized protein YndB with AHSA1/START domain
MSLEQSENAVSVTRRIAAPAATIFAVLCDPAHHVVIDGSDMLRSTPPTPVSTVGDRFAVQMWNAEMGDYEMTNEVVELESDRLIRWEPTMTRASRPEDQEGVGISAKQRWGFVLAPVSEAVTDVTETFDCSESPDWLKRAVKGGQRWIDAMTATLDRLASQVEAH